MMGHWRPTFNCPEYRQTVGLDCEGVLREVGGGPLQRALHGGRIFRKRKSEHRAAKVTLMEDGRVSRDAAGHDYTCATILGSR